MFTRYANPARFMKLSAWALPASACLAVALFAIGVPLALAGSPPDFRQGESVRIMYVHVPAAWWALGIYVFMGVASLMGLVWRHSLADVAARAAAPIGATFAALCLISGSFWGAPTWGTWWEWDARLTSMLILFLTYLGYMALWASIDDETRAARLAAVLCLAGLINIPIVKFSVEWWNSLHQPASIDVVRAAQGQNQAIADAMMTPLLVMAGAYGAAFAALLFAAMRAEIYRRRALAKSTRRAMS